MERFSFRILEWNFFVNLKVFKAKSKENGQIVALKIVKLDDEDEVFCLKNYYENYCW